MFPTHSHAQRALTVLVRPSSAPSVRPVTLASSTAPAHRYNAGSVSMPSMVAQCVTNVRAAISAPTSTASPSSATLGSIPTGRGRRPVRSARRVINALTETHRYLVRLVPKVNSEMECVRAVLLGIAGKIFYFCGRKDLTMPYFPM